MASPCIRALFCPRVVVVVVLCSVCTRLWNFAKKSSSIRIVVVVAVVVELMLHGFFNPLGATKKTGFFIHQT